MANANEIEQIVRLIPGISEVKVHLEEDEVSEIHVLSDSRRHPKQIVRDIESTLAAQMGIQIDWKKVSIAQIDDYENPKHRLVLDTLHVKMKGDTAEIQVELLEGENSLVGSVAGLASQRQRLRSAVMATLEAVQGSLSTATHLSIEDVGIVNTTDAKAVITIVLVVREKREELLVGCAYVRRDEVEAAARATLCALNRRLEQFYADEAQATDLLA